MFEGLTVWKPELKDAGKRLLGYTSWLAGYLEKKGRSILAERLKMSREFLGEFLIQYGIAYIAEKDIDEGIIFVGEDVDIVGTDEVMTRYMEELKRYVDSLSSEKLSYEARVVKSVLNSLIVRQVGLF